MIFSLENTSSGSTIENNDEYINNTTDYNVEDDNGPYLFYTLAFSLLACSIYSTISKACGNCSKSYRRYKKKNALYNYLLMNENEEYMESIEECSICLDKYLPKQKTIILDCGHKYHTQCITQWLLKDLSCPDCRTIIEI